MRKSGLIIASLFALSTLASCSSATQLQTSWKAPDVKQIQFKKVIAFVIVKDQALVRNAESQIVGRIKTVPCSPGFSVIADADRANSEKVAQQVDAAGFDGAVILRYAGQRTEQTYVPGSTTSMYGYYGYGYGVGYYDPGYVRQDQMVYVETTIYSVPDRKLLWAGTTESMNPTKARDTIDEIVDAVAEKMRKQGLIPAQ